MLRALELAAWFSNSSVGSNLLLEAIQPTQMSDSIPELRWTEAEEVQTKFGARLLRKASPTVEFIRHFEANAEQMRLAGYTLHPDRYTHHLLVSHWSLIPQAELEARKAALVSSQAVDCEIDIPCPVGREFRGYQRAGIAYIKSTIDRGAGVLLADEMGVGKTPQTIGYLNLETRICRALIICPAKLRSNWVTELRNWLTRKMSIGIVEGSCFPSSDIVISSFEMVHKFPNATSYFWDIVIIDEAHRLKDPAAKRSQHIFGFRGRGKNKGQNVSPIPTRRKLALTGTPMPNKIMEIWPTLSWLDAKRWSDQFKFGLRYCGGTQREIGRGRKAWCFDGASNQNELRELLRSTLMIRRLKRDVMSELPPKTRSIIELEGRTPTEEMREFKRIVSTFERKEKELAQVKDDFSAAVDFYEDDLRIAFDQMSRFRHQSALAKLEPFIEELNERMEDFEKVVIFGHHTDCIERMMSAFARFNPVSLVGSTRNPQVNVNRFQTDPGCRMIIGNDSMMEGHTLTASSTVIFFEADWVYGKLDQKESRCHRYGQQDNVLCLYYVLKDSLDARMIRRALSKQEKIDAALDK